MKKLGKTTGSISEDLKRYKRPISLGESLEDCGEFVVAGIQHFWPTLLLIPLGLWFAMVKNHLFIGFFLAVIGSTLAQHYWDKWLTAGRSKAAMHSEN